MVMLIDFTERTHVVAIWHLQGRNEDMQAALFRAAPGEPLQFRFRTRTYADDRAFDSEDKKEFYALNHVPADETEAIALGDAFLGEFVEMGYLAPGKRLERLDVNGNYERFLDLAQTVSWMHVRAVGGGAQA